MSYHYNHTHKEKVPPDHQGQQGQQGFAPSAVLEQGQTEHEPGSATSSVGGTPPSTPGQDAGGSIGANADLVSAANSGVEPKLFGRMNAKKSNLLHTY